MNGSWWSSSAGGGSGTVTGSGTSGRVAYWNGASSLTSNAAFTFDGTTLAATTFTGTAAASAVYNYSGATTSGSGFSGGAVRNYISGTEIWQYYNAGLQISSNMVLFVQDGTAANPGVTFASDPDTGLYRVSVNTINFTTGGTSRLALSTASFITTLPFSTTDATDASSITTGSGSFAGGLSCAKTLYVGTGANIAGLFTLSNATTVTTGNASTITGTLSSGGAGDTTGISAMYSSTGASSRNIYGADIEIAAGSTTAGGAIAGQFFNAVASVPTTLGGANYNAATSNGTGCTIGYRGYARGAGSKTFNIGGYNEATSGATNVGSIGHVPGVADTASFKGIGAIGAVQFPSATPTNFKGVGLWAVLNTTVANYSVASTFPALNCAIVGDNGDTTADIINLLDAGTSVWKLADGGGVTATGTHTTSNYIQFTANHDPGAPTDAVRVSAKVSTSGTPAHTLHIRAEEPVAADVALASTSSLRVWVNNVEYKIPLTAV